MSPPSWVNTKPAMGCSKKHVAIILSITNTITVIAIVIASERLAALMASSERKEEIVVISRPSTTGATEPYITTRVPMLSESTTPMRDIDTTTDILTTEAQTTTQDVAQSNECMRRGCCYASYIGPRDVSVNGNTCLMWEDMLIYETLEDLLVLNLFPEESWQEIGNKCRNPNNLPVGPWCFVLNDDQLNMEECGIDACIGRIWEDPCNPNPCANGGSCMWNETLNSTSCECIEGFGGPYCIASCDEPIPHSIINRTFTYNTNWTANGYPCTNALTRDVDENGVYWGQCFSSTGSISTSPICGYFSVHGPLQDYCSMCSEDENPGCKTEGIPYSGDIRVTSTGLTCIDWEYYELLASRTNHPMYYSDLHLFPESSFSQLRSKCRNPNNDPNGPWCFNLDADFVLNRIHCTIPECEVPLEPCSSNPCFNGGVCSNVETNGYRCNCTNGYKGKRCESAPRDCWKENQPYTGHTNVSDNGRPCVRWEYLVGAVNDIELENFHDTTWNTTSNNCRHWLFQRPGCIAFNDAGAFHFYYCSVPMCPVSVCPNRVFYDNTFVESFAASSYSANTGPERSPLNTQMVGHLSAGWTASQFSHQWIMVTLTQMLVVDGILTQGRGDVDFWMEKFTLKFKQTLDGNWTNVLSDDGTELFAGNIDRNSIKENIFYSPINARVVILYHELSVGVPSIRWDLIACDPIIGRPAYQSDAFLYYSPSVAIDGTISQAFDQGSCISVRPFTASWWSMDLGQTYVIHSLSIYPRLESEGCPDCLRSFNVFISSDSEDPTLSIDKELCLFREFPIDEQGMWLRCESEKSGRFVIIQHHELVEILTFCEVTIKYREVEPTRECYDFLLPYTGENDSTANGGFCTFWVNIIVNLPYPFNIGLFQGDRTWNDASNKCRSPYQYLTPMCPTISNSQYTIDFCDIPRCSAIPDFNFCEPNPCMNHGVCERVEYQDFHGFRCICRSGFYGLKCESFECLIENEAFTGNLDHSFLGVPCMDWSAGAGTLGYTWEQIGLPDTNWEAASNHCRLIRDVPYCFTYYHAEVHLLPCTLPVCLDLADCMTSVYTYTGDKDITRNGQRCVPWREAAGYEGLFVGNIGGNQLSMVVDQRELISDFSESELQVMGNKCRNPNDDPEGPWCYAAEMMLMAAQTIIIKPQYCDIPLCYAHE